MFKVPFLFKYTVFQLSIRSWPGLISHSRTFPSIPLLCSLVMTPHLLSGFAWGNLSSSASCQQPPRWMASSPLLGWANQREWPPGAAVPLSHSLFRHFIQGGAAPSRGLSTTPPRSQELCETHCAAPAEAQLVSLLSSFPPKATECWDCAGL